MLDNSVLPREILRHGAYVCLRLADGADRRAVAAAAIPALAEKLGLVNEFDPPGGPPAQSIAFLGRQDAAGGAIADDGAAPMRSSTSRRPRRSRSATSAPRPPGCSGRWPGCA